MSNYEISTALYGAKDKDTVTDESEDAVGGKNFHLFQVLFNFDSVETLHSVPRGVHLHKRAHLPQFLCYTRVNCLFGVIFSQ